MSEVEKKPYTKPEIRELRTCGDCGVKPGELHSLGCDVERCPLCGAQMIGCSCAFSVSGVDPDDWEAQGHEVPSDEMFDRYDAEIEKYGGRLPWTGEFPGVAECREFGWYSRAIVDDEGNHVRWERCDKDAPGASEDLNRLYGWGGAEWDKEKRRWVKR